MQIIIESKSTRETHRIMNDIYNGYRDKIRKIIKTKGTIELINGDCIKFINYDMKFSDGIKADVAISPYADILTIGSSHKKRVWDFADLENHIKGI